MDRQRISWNNIRTFLANRRTQPECKTGHTHTYRYFLQTFKWFHNRLQNMNRFCGDACNLRVSMTRMNKNRQISWQHIFHVSSGQPRRMYRRRPINHDWSNAKKQYNGLFSNDWLQTVSLALLFGWASELNSHLSCALFAYSFLQCEHKEWIASLTWNDKTAWSIYRSWKSEADDRYAS